MYNSYHVLKLRCKPHIGTTWNLEHVKITQKSFGHACCRFIDPYHEIHVLRSGCFMHYPLWKKWKLDLKIQTWKSRRFTSWDSNCHGTTMPPAIRHNSLLMFESQLTSMAHYEHLLWTVHLEFAFFTSIKFCIK